MLHIHKFTALLLLLLSTVLFASTANAHAPRENYVWVNGESDAISGRFEINTKDLDSKLGIEIPQGGSEAERLEAVFDSAEVVQAFLLENFSISDSQGEFAIEFLEPSIFKEGSSFIQYPYRTTRAPADDSLNIRNQIFVTPEYLADDRMHRSLLVVEYNKVIDKDFGKGNIALVFGPGKTEQELDMTEPGTILEWTDFLWQGILHIAIGLDHILFVIVLMLTVVVRFDNGRWEPVDSFKAALWQTARIVTLFTIAHSITLTLAALGLVNMNTAVIESIIALSIGAVALNNIFPRFTAHSWILIFGFGLFHGLGFATVMSDLQFSNFQIERKLLLFNVGVEIGQLTIVAIALPILYMLRKQVFYRPVIVNFLSVLAILVSLYWIAERTGLING